jgi:hypothetical protein
MTPSESDRTFAAGGNGDATGAADRRGVEVDQTPSSAVGSTGLRAVIWRRVSGLPASDETVGRPPRPGLLQHRHADEALRTRRPASGCRP